MKSVNLSVLSLLTFFIYSCSKEENTPASLEPNLVKSYTYEYQSGSDHGSLTYSVSYDAKNRISRVELNSDPTVWRSYSYPQPSILVIEGNAPVDTVKRIPYREEYILNSSSQPDSQTSYVSNEISDALKFIYNSNKQLIRLLDYDKSATGLALASTMNYEYNADGTINKAADEHTTTIYEYYDDLTSNIVNLFDPFLNLSPKLKKSTAATYDGGTPFITNYTYEFDDRKRLVKETATDPERIFTSVTTYTY